MRHDLSAVLAAIRSQPWAIMPEYLEAIEAIAARAMESPVLALLAEDGHQARIEASMQAVAAVGTRLEGARLSTLRGDTAVIPVIGPIFPRVTMVNASAGGTGLDAIMADLRVALASPSVERIVMVFDTPGGVVSGLGEAAESIRASSKPITAYVTGVAASAGYWLASQSGEIVADRAALLGNIGVVASLSHQEAPGQDGRRTYEIVSSNAPNKRPDPTTEEGRAALQELVDAIERVFMTDVARGRKVTLATVRAEYGRGATVAAARAVELGMADRIGTLEGVLKPRSQGSAGGQGRGGRSRALAAAQLETRQRSALRS